MREAKGMMGLEGVFMNRYAAGRFCFTGLTQGSVLDIWDKK